MAEVCNVAPTSLRESNRTAKIRLGNRNEVRTAPKKGQIAAPPQRGDRLAR